MDICNFIIYTKPDKVRLLNLEVKMEITISIDKMTTEEKIQTMETIWDDLCKKAESIPSPSWHKEVLQEREDRVNKGKEKFLNWNSAKKYIQDKVS